MTSWTVLIPVKDLTKAKTRFRSAHAPATRLALAFALDTARAVAQCGAAGRVIVVTGDATVRAALTGTGVETLPEGPREGLNEALRHAAAAVRVTDPGAPLAAMPSDLPALRPRDLTRALTEAARHPRAFVPDAPGLGTVLLTARDGGLDPRFGPDSAAAHRASGAAELRGDWPSLRRDVDTVADLAEAARLGIGGDTAALMARPE